MTKQEAIEVLKGIVEEASESEEAVCYVSADEDIDALNMAIESLEEQERPEIIRCRNCRHDNNCEIQYSAQAGSKFFCGSAERKDNE